MDFITMMRSKYLLMLHYIGVILIMTGLILLLPLTMMVFYPSEIKEVFSFIIPASLVILFGTFIWWKTSDKKRDIAITFQDGGIIVVISWVFICLISAMPFIISGQLTFTQGVFESVSGWTTTGLSVVDVTKTSHMFLMWRSIMQFFGGAGIAVIMLSAIIGPGGLGLYSAEGRTDLLLPNITKSTKLIMTIYSGYIFVGTVLYTVAGMPLFDSINHAIAALSTGGFSTVPKSIGEYDSSVIELITIILMFAGTVNFAAHYIFLKGNIKRFFKLSEIRFMLFMLSVMIPLVAFFSIKPLYYNISKTLRVSIFELVSALSTTGFSTVAYGDWNDFGIVVMIILMFIGGGTGSTAGGIKQYRVYVLAKSLFRNIKGFMLPAKAIKEIHVEKPEGRVFLKDQEVIQIGNFVFLYFVIYFIGVSIMVIHGYSLRDSMFEFASSIGTVGLSVGITSPAAPLPVLWIQIVGMLFGRLEIFVIFYAVIKLTKDMKAIFRKSKG